MQNLLRVLNRLFQRGSSTTDLNTPDQVERVKSLMNCLEKTLDNEADCREFDAQMDCIAEALANGRTAAEVITPEFEAHLMHSYDCQEEFNALLAILKAEEAGELENL